MADHEDRLRQAHIAKMIDVGSVMPDPYGVPVSSHSKSSSKSNSPTSRSRTSPSHSQSRSRRSGERLPADTIGVGLTFQKQDVDIVSPANQPSSHLAQQLQLARSALDDSNFPRSSSLPSHHRFTVYLPHEEGSMVQIEVAPNCTAHQLVKVALACAKAEAGGELPVGLLDDPWSYVVHVAEEDGEVDTDYPCCDVRMNVVALGVDSFVLRDRVDVAPAAAVAGRAPAGSIIEGPGVDHSRSESTSAKKGFASLETENEERQTKPKPEEGEQACCTNCTIQ